MNDWWHSTTKALDHHRGALLGIAMSAAVSTWLFACQATAPSLSDPRHRVTRHELAMEIDAAKLSFEKRQRQLATMAADLEAEAQSLEAAAAASTEELEEQEALRTKVVELLGGFAVQAAEGVFEPASALAAVVSLAGIGAAAGLGADNIRKDRVIRDMKDTSTQSGA